MRRISYPTLQLSKWHVPTNVHLQQVHLCVPKGLSDVGPRAVVATLLTNAPLMVVVALWVYVGAIIGAIKCMDVTGCARKHGLFKLIVTCRAAAR